MGKTTKLSMFDSTWSPVTGCKHGCPFCYARRIASRFEGFDIMDKRNAPNERWWETEPKSGLFEIVFSLTRKTKEGDTVSAPYPFGFAPTLHVYKLKEPQKWKEPKDIFVCSMADLFGDYIPENWIDKVLDACNEAPWHRYFFLTKNPKRYIDMFNRMDDAGITDRYNANFPNWWFGTTVTRPDQPYFFRRNVNCFLSLEPIMEDFPVDDHYLKEYGIKWVIVGAETGNRVGRAKPEKAWINHIAESCRMSGIPLFMKDSLRELMGKDFIQEKP